MSVGLQSSQAISEKQTSGLSAAAANQTRKSEQEEKTQKSEHSTPLQDKRFDTYDKTPEKSDSEFSGIYHLAEEEDGTPKIIQDVPAPDGDKSAAPSEPDPKVSDDQKPDKPEEELCTGNTDQVDAEIKKLREEKQQLEQKLNAATDPTQKVQLETRLTSIEAELQSKDTDSYRKQHTTFTNTKL